MDSIIEDHSQLEMLAQKVEEAEAKHVYLEDCVAKLSASAEEADQKASGQTEKLKSDLAKKINQGLQEVEKRITDLVQTALQEQGTRALKQTSRPAKRRWSGNR